MPVLDPLARPEPAPRHGTKPAPGVRGGPSGSGEASAPSDFEKPLFLVGDALFHGCARFLPARYHKKKKKTTCSLDTDPPFFPFPAVYRKENSDLSL